MRRLSGRGAIQATSSPWLSLRPRAASPRPKTLPVSGRPAPVTGARNSDLRPEGPSARLRAAAHASCGQHASSMTKPRAADAARVTPQACLRHDTPQACLRHDTCEAQEGETFVRSVWVRKRDTNETLQAAVGTVPNPGDRDRSLPNRQRQHPGCPSTQSPWWGPVRPLGRPWVPAHGIRYYETCARMGCFDAAVSDSMSSCGSWRQRWPVVGLDRISSHWIAPRRAAARRSTRCLP